MKPTLFRSIPLFLITLSWVCPGQARADCAPAPSGLVSWWAGEGNGSDNAGRNAATLQNLTFGAGEVGQGFVFNGTNAYVRVPASTGLNVGLSNGFTLEAWINPAALDRRPLFEWNQTTNGWAGMGVHLWLSYNISGDLYADLLDSGGSDHLMATTNGVMTTNSFQHVALTYDKTTGLAVIYRNGLVVLSTNLGVFTPRTSFDLYMGRRPWATGPYADQYLKGTMDEVSLYNRVLSAGEVAAIYGAGASGKCALWPVIVTQPTNQLALEGQNVSLSVSASGDPPLSYQWRCNGTNVPAGTGAMLTLTNVQATNAGTYWAVVTNQYGSATSSNAALTVLPSVPTVLTQPVDRKVWMGYTAGFSVTVTGAPPLSLQWICNGTNIAGATNVGLSLTNVQYDQAGSYRVQVTNQYGSNFSSYAYLTVRAPGTVLEMSQAGLEAAMASAPTVIFDSDGVITLTNRVAVTGATTIDGTGHGITISGGHAAGLFSVGSGASAAFVNLTLANGYVVGSAGTLSTDGGPGMGGAILNNGGAITLTGCTVASNTAVGGAGYLNCIWPTNSAGGRGLGGAICSLAGSVSVTNCNFTANQVLGGAGGANMDGAAGGDACGGAIYSPGGSVAVQNSTFVSQTVQGGAGGPGAATYGAGSGLGGAIWISDATHNFYNSSFTGNSAGGADLPYGGRDRAGSGKGGAIFATNGTVNCVGCTFTANNVAAGYKVKNGSVGFAQGGAIWSEASLSVSQSSFIGNSALGKGNGNVGTSDDWAGEGSGGAIFSTSALSLSDSTFANNGAQGGYGGIRQVFNCPGGIGRGGAICSLGILTATNCTLAANSALGGAGGTGGQSVAPAGGDGMGGGFFNTNGTATLVNLTFASNNATGGAGGAGGPAGASSGGAICNSGGTVSLLNTLLAHSTSGGNCSGMVFDLGHNLSSDNSAGFYAAGSLNNTDPVLAPLDNYGGPTLTMALLAGSPAIDGGDPVSYPPADQRGHARPFGSAPDIGAFESSPPWTVRGTISGATLQDDVGVTVGWCVTTTTNHGSYAFYCVDTGTSLLTPQSPSYLFLPANRSVTVGPDLLGVNFKAYRWNALSFDDVTNSTMHVVFAGTNGLSYRLLSSGNLRQWSPVATNAIGPSSYWEMYLPIGVEGQQSYRTVTP
jgi:hypothetical protein